MSVKEFDYLFVTVYYLNQHNVSPQLSNHPWPFVPLFCTNIDPYTNKTHTHSVLNWSYDHLKDYNIYFRFHPVFYRITFALREPFIEQFSDRESSEAIRLRRSINEAIDKLYESFPGTQSANVIKIE